jgi:hypothetical protein
MVRAVALSARVRAQRLSETHLERKQVGIVGRRCQRADALCELVEVVLCIVIRREKEDKGEGTYLVLARGADGEPDVRCEGVEVFRTDYLVVGMRG